MISSVVKSQLHRLLDDASRFAAEVDTESRELWLSGLDLLKTEHPLMTGQDAAWKGIAECRAALLLGPPGTGKTHCLSAMIVGYMLACRRSGKPCRIFVSAFTRNAIVNVLNGVVSHQAYQPDADFPIFFLGENTALEPRVTQLPTSSKTIESSLFEMDKDVCVVGGTVWSMSKILENEGRTEFDLVCIDESSQMLLSHGLLAMAGISSKGRVLVVGDNKQLAPIRAGQDEANDPMRLTGSLYDFLQTAQVPEFRLDETFRLNAPLSYFPAAMFYDGQYRSAEAVEGRRLRLRAGWDSGLEPWQQTLLDPNIPIVVCLHDGLPAGTLNPFEATLARDIAILFHDAVGAPPSSDFWSKQFAIISPHRAQNSCIRRDLKSTHIGVDAMVETVDRIQGKEREAILVSYTVADAEFALSEAEFLFNPQRLNVMITRAETKLVMLVSRRLLEVVPPDEEVFEHAQTLREFLFDTQELGSFVRSSAEGRVQVSLRGKSFGEELELLPEVRSLEAEELPDLTPELESVFRAVQKAAIQSQYGSATDRDLKRILARKPEFSELQALLKLGMIRIDEQVGDKYRFWKYFPQDVHRPPLTIDEHLYTHLEEVIPATRKGRFPPTYTSIRNRFAWLDASARDILLPRLDELAASGQIIRGETPWGAPTFDLAPKQVAAEDTVPLPPPDTNLTDTDYSVLNDLEDIEVGRINFGVTESWVRTSEIVEQAALPRDAVLESLHKLEVHGFLMAQEGGRFRSRMAELARELRYVKQRFDKGDSQRSPYLIRALKLETVQRKKPVRDRPIDSLLELPRLKSEQGLRAVLEACLHMVKRLWGTDATIAGFQARAFEQILTSWLGGDDAASYVITADTGSGKTEAALLPLFVGAAFDRLNGLKGCRAVLVYPRVRLGANQAQRLVRYLSLFNEHKGIEPLSVGLQNGEVPSSFDEVRDKPEHYENWPSRGELEFLFPFFGCPQCEQDLNLAAGQGRNGRDLLTCPSCAWSFEDWVGTKAGLRESPPTFFLPVTESLHQWQSTPEYGAIFGDGGSPPRAILADEIHLYSHVHGAQVGYTLRRLIARLVENGEETPLAIGMSATLSDPTRVWAELCGRGDVVNLTPTETEKETNVRGREYFYFVQPEVESRGQDIAGASTAIQSLMCLAHGMRRRTGTEGGFRGIVFLDSIDKLKRLHSDFFDAEESLKLSELRTYRYDDDPVTGDICRECCREPMGCDRFRGGECWYFAATDEAQWTAKGRYKTNRPLAVASRPVFSGTSGRVEELLKQSDLIFATSTLEVGYDDPDIALVYQHYAPTNLASFIQRKGRGGRGADDRPLTGVTLSVYSARDSWYFRAPRKMLDSSQFFVPLNITNYFVMKGQAVAVLLDTLASFRNREGRMGLVKTEQGIRPDDDELVSQADGALRRVLGPRVLETLNIESSKQLFEDAFSAVKSDLAGPHWTWRQEVKHLPQRLFDAINLPEIEVVYPGCNEPARVDIGLAFSECAPGNMTRRYGLGELHWTLPAWEKGLFLPENCYNRSTGVGAFEPFPPEDDFASRIKEELPLEISASLGDEIYPKVCRPGRIELASGGHMSGGKFISAWAYDEPNKTIIPEKKGTYRKQGPPFSITHKSRGFLRSFSVVVATPELSSPGKLGDDSFKQLAIYKGGEETARTGLSASRLYWGCDISLRLQDRNTKEASFYQRFVYPQTDKTLFHGYQVEAEGVRFHLDSDRLDRFVAYTIARLANDVQAKRVLSGRHLGYLMESRCLALGVNSFEANRLSELLISAAATDEGREALKMKRWDRTILQKLVKDTFEKRLHRHPLLSERRLERLNQIFELPAFEKTYRDVFRVLTEPDAMKSYIRSLILHSLAIRLKELFVLFGRGDERRAFFHAKLPVQFGNASEDIITIFENGSHGDGTTRTFVESLDAFWAELNEAHYVDCPSAAEDRAVEQMLNAPDLLEKCRGLDPRGTQVIELLGEELCLEGQGSYGRILQLLFGHQTIGLDQFKFLDLLKQVRDIERAMTTSWPRPPSTWELISEVVTRAKNGEGEASRLYDAYSGLEDVSHEESLSAKERLSEQIHRFAAPLCPDGCEACLHGGSDIMTTTLARNAVSRRLLRDFYEFETPTLG